MTKYPTRKHRFSRLMYIRHLLQNLVWPGLSTWRLRRAIKRTVKEMSLPKRPPNEEMRSLCYSDFGRMDSIVIIM